MSVKNDWIGLIAYMDSYYPTDTPEGVWPGRLLEAVLEFNEMNDTEFTPIDGLTMFIWSKLIVKDFEKTRSYS